MSIIDLRARSLLNKETKLFWGKALSKIKLEIKIHKKREQDPYNTQLNKDQAGRPNHWRGLQL